MEARRETKSYEGYPWHEKNKEALKEYARKYREGNPEYKKRNADKAKKDRLENPEYFKAREFSREMKKYNTTVEWYRDRLIEQSGLCAICSHLSHHHGTLQRLQVDHNHLCCDLHTKSCGKCLRGLLCADCNILLSYFEKFQENAIILPKSNTWEYKAAYYIDSYKQKHFKDFVVAQYPKDLPEGGPHNWYLESDSVFTKALIVMTQETQ